jgi:hypothetical protein
MAKSKDRAERRRLLRLRGLAEGLEEWALENVQPLLAQNPEDHDSRCPHFAGIITDGSNKEMLVADSEQQIAQMMSRAITASDVHLAAEELVDLDNGERRPANTTVTISFLPTPSPVNAGPAHPAAQ